MTQRDGHTALTLAASRGHSGSVSALLANGANMEARSKVTWIVHKFTNHVHSSHIFKEPPWAKHPIN